MFANSVGSTTTSAATLALKFVPVVTEQPVSVTDIEGNVVDFTGHRPPATPSPTRQWQVSTNDGATFTNITGRNGTQLAVAPTGLSQDGNQYRSVFTNPPAPRPPRWPP